MVVVECSVPGCGFKTNDASEALAIALLANHGLAHQPSTTPVNTGQALDQAPRGPKLDRPKVNLGVSTEEWNIFIRRWDVFRVGSGINETSAPSQLFQCAGPELGDSILKANPQAAAGSLAQLLETMRSLAVIPVAQGVLRTELLQLHQERDETFRAFSARVRGKAETCALTTDCECGKKVDYSHHVIGDVLLNGLYDPDIRREILGTKNITETPVNELISMVENKEMARNALPTSSMSAMSAFRRQQNTAEKPAEKPSASDRSKEATCPDCRSPFKIFSEGNRGWNVKPHTVCLNCYRARRRKRGQRQTQPTTQATSETDHVSQIAAIQPAETESRRRRNKRRHRHNSDASATHNITNRRRQVILDHHIFTKGEWKRARLRPHPKVAITVSFAHHRKDKDHQTRQPGTHADVSAVADTGAQSDLWSLKEYLANGFSRDDLSPVSLSLSAANHSAIKIEGAFFASLSVTSPDGQTTSCQSMMYVSSSVQTMYLSCETLLNLGILSPDFPSIPYRNESREGTPDMPTTCATRTLNDGCTAPHPTGEVSCSCPQREVTPLRPSKLPFECIPENNGRMKAWLLDRYAPSTFNTCPHRALPSMEGPPVEIHVDPDATPKACHTPATIPIHWQQRVYNDLLRDEALGVVERVPYGEPVTWCHRMVVTRKHDGSPRRTVDLSPLNKYCQRETFATESPFHLARRIPKDTWKTVTDAWNGYHSVPLRQSDRHLTTFITPFGRWRYLRAPQGFLSSGDGYNRRFDAILSNFERKERCVDDTVHYDQTLEAHWWRTIDLLTRLGQSGIVLNPGKFQFAERSVDFAGFRVSDSTIEPLPKYLDAIRDFPSPSSTTDIRSWFGLVNQVSNYAQLRDTMAPFKPFLSPRRAFSWSPELESAFITSKDAIIKSIRQGVEIFDITRRTCLRPDWSKRGVGYFLLQQYCTCPSGTPDCCPDGWRITLAGSRFLSSAEERYAAIEGEALAVAWGLEQTKYFTQGCDNLIIITDHKPLVKIFGDRTLDEIANSRLFRLKQRTLPWRFEIRHMPGKSNHAADATSRHPSPSGNIAGMPHSLDSVEDALMASINNQTTEIVLISWELLAKETADDKALMPLLEVIEQGKLDFDRNDPNLAMYWPIREALYIYEGVLLYQDRVVVPPSLRHRVLQHLHAAHQGTSSMEQRARSIVYWPGMTKDIRQIRDSCADCNRNAPSQAATAPIASSPPTTPFEEVFADFFEYGGSHYLVVGDRLSGWVEVFGSKKGTDSAGSAGLIHHLRRFFSTFGVPNELSSDGGPEFTAGATDSFLRLWGIRHRVSSAYFPQSNGRAEVAVKTAKRLLRSNTGPSGSLDSDRFLSAMLQLRNTPDPDCNVSPAQIIFGRPINDTLSFVNKLEKFSNPHIRPTWREAWNAKENALRSRMVRTSESLKEHSRPLRPLSVGDKVFLQNQQGPNPNKWDRSGIVVESSGNDQYRVKVDGSGRLTLRNRRFLRVFTPVASQIRSNQPMTTDTSPDTHTSTPCTRKVPAEKAPVTPPQTILPDKDGAHEGEPVSSPIPVDTPSSIPSSPQATEEQAPPTLPQRPGRERRPPRRYEPETGQWI